MRKTRRILPLRRPLAAAGSAYSLAKRNFAYVRKVPRAIKFDRPIGLPSAVGSLKLANTGFFPLEMWGEMRYQEGAYLTTGSSGTTGTELIWRLNSVYDPNFQVGGHQPNEFDQAAALYSNYQVMSCRVQIVWNYSGVNGLICLAQVSNYANTLTTNGLSPYSVAERPMTRSLFVNATGDHTQQTMDFEVDMAGITGVSKNEYRTNELYQSLVTGDPNYQIVVRLNCGATGGQSTENVIAHLYLTYKVRFWNKKTQAESS